MSFRYQLLIAFLLSLQTKMRDDLNFDDLFRLYYDSLFRFARQFINDDEDCHDIVSNAYEDVWRNFSHIEEKTVKAYLYTTEPLIICGDNRKGNNIYPMLHI